MSIADAFYPVERESKIRVMHATWGHLAPKDGDHSGHMIFAEGQYRDIVVIASTWRDAVGKEVDGSPWLYQAENDFAYEKTKAKQRGEGVYRFDGVMRMCKNGRIKFIGKVRRIKT